MMKFIIFLGWVFLGSINSHAKDCSETGIFQKSGKFRIVSTAPATLGCINSKIKDEKVNLKGCFLSLHSIGDSNEVDLVVASSGDACNLTVGGTFEIGLKSCGCEESYVECGPLAEKVGDNDARVACHMKSKAYISSFTSSESPKKIRKVYKPSDGKFVVMSQKQELAELKIEEAAGTKRADYPNSKYKLPALKSSYPKAENK